jgi:hypothetical protein
MKMVGRRLVAQLVRLKDHFTPWSLWSFIRLNAHTRTVTKKLKKKN